MMNFDFKAPTLFEANAVPNENEILHDEPRETSERLVKIKKFVLWLKAEMEKKGLVTNALMLDPSGWVFEIQSDEGGVMCIAGNLDGEDESRITLSVSEIGGAPEGVDHAVEALLSRSSEIAEMNVMK